MSWIPATIKRLENGGADISWSYHIVEKQELHQVSLYLKCYLVKEISWVIVLYPICPMSSSLRKTFSKELE